MTRAKRRLVFSATEPYADAGRSDVVEPRRHGLPGLAAAAGRAAFDLPGAASRSDAATRHRHRDAAAVARDPRAPPARGRTDAPPDERAHRPGGAPRARMGRRRSGDRSRPAADAAAREFGAPAAAVAQLAWRSSSSTLSAPASSAARSSAGPATRCRSATAARCCASTAWRSSTMRDGPVWWVLDYKLQHAPEQLDELSRAVAPLPRGGRARAARRGRALRLRHRRRQGRRSRLSAGSITGAGRDGGARVTVHALHGKKPHFSGVDRAIDRGSGRLQSAQLRARDAHRCRFAIRSSSPPRAFGHFALRRLLGKSELTMVWLASDVRTGTETLLSMPRLPPTGASSSATG